MKSIRSIIYILMVLTVSTVSSQTNTEKFSVDFETFNLENGLIVILHQDRSDPVVAVALTAHVGSAREKEGRTGFAHLFEHLLFLESENLGKGGLDKLSARIGGSGANGSTSRDRTNYFQTVPSDALEKMIWAEADKLGFFINTVTEPVLAKEKQVVKNEKRQGVDNRPYGHTFYVVDRNLYPEDHPYNWQVIGSLEDLQNATLQDVKEFYNRWYVPNNVILTISGDFDKEQAKEWVHKYFDEIPQGPEVQELEKQPVNLQESKNLYHEDNFAKLPELTLTWPSVYSYHKDSFALEILANYLGDGKNAPLYKKLVEKKKLSGNVAMFNYTSELAGQLMLQVRAYEGKDLDSVKIAIEKTFSEFEKNGIPQRDLKRIKAGLETNFYNSISSVLGKGFQLAQYEIFAKDPNFINKEVDKMLAVTADDVLRVFRKYIKDKNYVATSFVPKGDISLALENSQKAEVVEEKIVEGAEEDFDPNQNVSYKKTPSSFDRSIEPPYHGKPELNIPEIWDARMPSGMQVMGITNNEVPVVRFSLEMKGGQLLENRDKAGVSNMLASMMTKGTAKRTPAELEEAIELLGAEIYVNAGEEKITISGNTLAKNYAETMNLVKEILLEPRWDEKEFELLKQQILSELQEEKGDPNAIAQNEFKKLIYGENSILSYNQLGTPETVRGLSIEDLKNYYEENLSPLAATFLAVGAVNKSEAVNSVKAISANWAPRNIKFPEIPEFELPEKSRVYFYDVPGAKQSVFAFGAPSLSAKNEDFYPAEVMNYRLGGGSFASRLTQELREGKGYTYGIRSRFTDRSYIGPFMITSGVRTNITYEAAELVRDIVKDYATTFDEKDLEVTKSYMIKSNARRFETLGAKLNMLREISDYGYNYDYIKEREQKVEELNVLDIQDLAKKYVDPDRMYYLIVGDAETQLDRLEELGYGKPILLNEENSSN
ncbi:M16 family metallopeptidase [Christiangramia sabulilitoris]|uniref:Insulinase family protein n=1 Tax=Christiangramia sabulilitoris TaxID=2583991 RepID=A0A550I2U7_9FLAO|nr:pitrilysin family protein [Christiangramia sabulilitoris]TRO65279.1 insulinase family protein [Christiangramia sabulilitoris]